MDFTAEQNLVSKGNLVRVLTFQSLHFVDSIRVMSGFELPEPMVGFIVSDDTNLELFYDGTMFMSYAKELGKDVKELTSLYLVELYLPKYRLSQTTTGNGHKHSVEFREIERREVVSVMKINLVNSELDEFIKEPLLELTKMHYLANPAYTSIFNDKFSTLTYTEMTQLKQYLSSPILNKELELPLKDMAVAERKQASPYENSIKSISLDFHKKD